MSIAAAPRPPRQSLFLRSVRAAVLADFEVELELIEAIAVLQAAGFKRTEVARKLVNATSAELRAAELRLKHAAERLDAGD